MYRQRFPDAQQHDFTRSAYVYERPSFGQRVRETLGLVIMGVVLLCASIGVQLWNEGRAVRLAQSLDEGFRELRVLDSPNIVSTDSDRQLVHVTGPLTTDKDVVDSVYGVRVRAVRLRRVVEMFQWVEETRTVLCLGAITLFVWCVYFRTQEVNGEQRTETSYSYIQDWRKGFIDSNHFHSPHIHHNPDPIVENENFVAGEVKLGLYRLSPDLVAKVTSFERLTLEVPSSHPSTILIHNCYYHSIDPNHPRIGDTRVSFEVAGLSSSTVSVVAKQSSDWLVAYDTRAGDSISLLYMGHHSPQSMLMSEQRTNTLLTWGLRLVGWFVAFAGFTAMTNVIVTLTDSVPLLRHVISYGVHTLNVFLSLGLSLVVIATGWVIYRPLIGCLALFIVFAPFVWSHLRHRLNAQSQPNRSL